MERATGLWMRVALALGVLTALPAPVQAEQGDAEVVALVERHAKVPTARARRIVRTVSDALAANADRGGDRYDRLRQAVGRKLFGASGPGRTRAVYEARLAQVLARMYRGLDGMMLGAIFTEDYDVEACAEDLGLSARDCRALSKAARAGQQWAPPPVVQPPAPSAEGLRASARAHFAAGRHAQALSAYQRAVQLDPRHAGAHAGAGASQLALGQPHDAVTSYRAAIALEPRRAGFHAALGRALAAAGDRRAAVASYRYALRLDPGNGAARQGLAGLAPAAQQPTRFARAQQPQAAARSAPATGRFPRYQGPHRFNAAKAPAAAKPSEPMKAAPAPAASAPSGPVAATDDLLAQARDAARGALEGVKVEPVAKGRPRASAVAGPTQDDLMEGLMADPLGEAPEPEPAVEEPSGEAQEAEIAEGEGAEAAEPSDAGEPAEVLEAVEPAPVALPEQPSREVVGAVLKSLTPFVAQCAPRHRGILKVKVTIDGPSGAVSGTEVADELADSASCIDAVLGVADFRPFSRPSLTVGYPFPVGP